MSTFLSRKYEALEPYVPGEQPKDMQYVKLNTNENPFPPSEKALAFAAEKTRPVHLYSDPECVDLRKALSETCGVTPDQVICTNGSDEVLNFAFMAFCDEAHPAVFPDLTYGFYPVFAKVNGVPYEEIPLKDDFSVDPEDYIGIGKNIFIANPNAPTGKNLPLSSIEAIVRSNPDNVVVIDEAYVDFGGESAINLTKQYDNLLVTQTFSKSRSMAGARLGYGIGSEKLIADLNTIRYSTNPYNVNSYTAALGEGTLKDPEYTKKNCQTVIENREALTAELRKLGFAVPDSKANFVFVKHSKCSGEEIYRKLKENGVLVRHFTKERIVDFNRITVGTKEQNGILIKTLQKILKED